MAVAEAGYSGTLSGIEQVITLTAQNNTAPISVTGITRTACSGGTFSAPVAISPGGWSVAAGAGLNGADAIEGYAPLAGLGANGPVRFYVSANLAGQPVADVIQSQNGSGGGTPIIATLTGGLATSTTSVPTLHPGALVLLALAIAALSHRRLRRHLPPLAAVTLAITLGLTGGKSAQAVIATITPDGNIADWSGIAPVAQDSLGDTANGNPANDLAAFYLAYDGTNLHYRVDVVGLSNHNPVANPEASATAFNTPVAFSVLTNDTDPDGDTLTVTGATVVGGGSTGTVAIGAGGALTFSPASGFSGTGTVNYAISDGRGGTANGVWTVTVSAAVDNTPPVTTAAPAISVAATDTTASVTQTINENGTGYYLVLPAASAAPTVAEVKAGTSFAMTGGVVATVSLTGLAASTPYKYYFVAKDSANNDQAAVSTGLAITTTAAPDVTPPITTAAPAISVAASDTTASVTQTINENGTGFYLVLPAASAAPTVAAVKAGASFAMTGGVVATVSLTGLAASTPYKYYFVAKDSANNDQTVVSTGLAITTTAAPDVTAPVTTAAPSVSGTTDTGTTLSATINETGTGYYLVQAAAAVAPTVAAVQAGTSFAMTANVAANPAISGLLASTAYMIYFVAKDAANNVQAAVQSVAVTTSADVTPPAAPTGLALNNGAASTSNNFVSLDGLTTPPDADLAAWFVSINTSSAPAAASGGWSSIKPTTVSFAFSIGVTEPLMVCVFVKDTSNNVQPTPACDTIDKVP